MTTHTPEYRLMQNPALGGICLWAFACRYWEAKNRSDGVSLALAPCVLPVVFHHESVELLHRRRFDGGLLNALADDRSFAVALQERMENMLSQTFEALNVAFAANLIELDKTRTTLKPVRLTRPESANDRSLRPMLGVAERLGYWFAVYPLEQICGYLRLRL